LASADGGHENYVIQNYPILDALKKQGMPLSKETISWMQKWQGMDADASEYSFPELLGSTSVILKIQKSDPVDPKNSDSHGSFLPRNDSGNPYVETAYFNLSAILGRDHLFRVAAPYYLGPRAMKAFENLLKTTTITDANRIENKKKVLAMIATGQALKGCLKAKKPASYMEFDGMGTGGPATSHPVIQALQAFNPKPVAGQSIVLMSGYTGDLLELSKEYSVIMILDSIFQQWDRYSGGNVGLQKSKDGRAHFYFSDNGGADFMNSTSVVEKNLARFSRYDRDLVEKLRAISEFLDHPSREFLDYSDPQAFVVDLGLYSELTPVLYLERFQRNLKMVLAHIDANISRYGEKAYFE